MNITVAAAAAIARLDALPWIPARKAGAVARPLARPSSGRPVNDNAIHAELRVRHPKIVKQHPPHGGRALNAALASQVRDDYIGYHAHRLGVARREIKLHNRRDLYTATYYIQRGSADKLVRYLEGATCTVQAAPRLGGAASGLCGCGQPLDGNDRTSCTTCKSARNSAEKQRRRRATTGSKSPRRSTARIHVPANVERGYQRVQQPIPIVYPDRPATSVHIHNDQRITIIDFRPQLASDRPLTHQQLLDTAATCDRGTFRPTDGGRIDAAISETTDVAYIVTTPEAQVVVWVAQANAAVGYASHHTHSAMRVGVDVGKLLHPQGGPRGRKDVLGKLVAAARTITSCSDMTDLADMYQLSCEADRELSLPQKDSLAVNELLDQQTIRPTTKGGWDVARGFLNNDPNFRHTDMVPAAISRGALIG